MFSQATGACPRGRQKGETVDFSKSCKCSQANRKVPCVLDGSLSFPRTDAGVYGETAKAWHACGPRVASRMFWFCVMMFTTRFDPFPGHRSILNGGDPTGRGRSLMEDIPSAGQHRYFCLSAPVGGWGQGLAEGKLCHNRRRDQQN